jgi:hypothetical protein
MRTLRASEIGRFVFCQRAWWLQLQGFESQNKAQMDEGEAFHREHGQQVFITGLVRLVGYGLLLLALVALSIGVTLYLLKGL